MCLCILLRSVCLGVLWFACCVVGSVWCGVGCVWGLGVVCLYLCLLSALLCVLLFRVVLCYWWVCVLL